MTDTEQTAAKDSVDNSTPSEGKTSSAVQDTTEKPLSKNQIKKRKRLEKLTEIKKRKKIQQKERKRAKAIAEGRDLDEERRLQEERAKSGEGKKKRLEKNKLRMKNAETSFKVCIDCGFDDLMTEKETNSLANQLRYCYATNNRSPNPVYISASGIGGNNPTYLPLKKLDGFPDTWHKKGFRFSEKKLEELHEKSSLVYLTSDSSNTIEHLDDSKTYVIGGIVDRNRLKRTTIEKAEKLGIQTAKLPIDEYLKLCATKVLTVNHVFDILLKYRQNGNDWKKAMLAVLPQRKDITEKEEAPVVNEDSIANGDSGSGEKETND